MIEKKSLLRLLDLEEYKRVLDELKTIENQNRSVTKLQHDLNELNNKYEKKNISRQKHKSELTKLVQSIREKIESLPEQDISVPDDKQKGSRWKRILIVGGAFVTFLGIGGSFSEFTGFSLRDIFFSKNEVKQDTLNQVNVKASGDKSPAINAPGGEVKIEYQELQPSKNAIDKRDKPKN